MISDNRHLLQIRRLSWALIISGAFNITLGALFFYWFFKERPPTPYCELKPADQKQQHAPLAIDRSNHEIIRTFRKISMEHLIAQLSNLQLVENGYTQRDLALACLIAFHHFDLSRALLGEAQPEQQRVIAYAKNKDGAGVQVIVYPGLTGSQFQAIMHFAHTERWPLTSQGLYLLLQKQPLADLSLADAFYLSREFLAVDMLFNRAEVSVEKSELFYNWTAKTTTPLYRLSVIMIFKTVPGLRKSVSKWLYSFRLSISTL